MLTTIDNPFNPHTQFDEWNAFDVSMGYNTCAYLARIAKISHELSDADQEAAIDAAITEIIQLNINGKYRRIEKDEEVRINMDL